MINKESIALFLGGIFLISSIELSFYGGNYYISILLLILGVASLVYGYMLNQIKQNIIPVLENELHKTNLEISKIIDIIDTLPKRDESNAVLEQMMIIANSSQKANETLEKLFSLTEKECKNNTQELISLRNTVTESIKREDILKIIECTNTLINLPITIKNTLDSFLNESAIINKQTKAEHKEVFNKIKENNEALLNSCRDSMINCISTVENKLEKTIQDAEILKNDYLNNNNTLIDKQLEVTENTEKILTAVSRNLDNRMNALIEQVQNVNIDSVSEIKTLSEELNKNVEGLCDDIREKFDGLTDDINISNKRFIRDLSTPIKEMSTNIETLGQSYNEFQKNNEKLISAFTKMSEADAKIIKSILPK